MGLRFEVCSSSHDQLKVLHPFCQNPIPMRLGLHKIRVVHILILGKLGFYCGGESMTFKKMWKPKCHESLLLLMDRIRHPR